MRKLYAVFIIIFFFSCNKKKEVPDGILPPRKMQIVLWDYLRADVYAKDFIKRDSFRNDTTENLKLQNKIFSFYHISRQDFYKSYDYYTAHPELLTVLMDSILAKQNRIKLKAPARINNAGKIMNDQGRGLKEHNKLSPFNKDKIVPGKKKITPTKKAMREY